MATRPSNPLVELFRALMRERGFRKHRSWYYKEDNGIMLCFHLQRSMFDAAYFLNAGLTDPTLLSSGELPTDISGWHACGRSEFIMKHLTGKNEGIPYPDTTSSAVLSGHIDAITGLLAKAAEALRNRNVKDFPLALLWIQRFTREEMFSPQR